MPGGAAAAYCGRLVASLSSSRRRLGPRGVIAFGAETVGGATAGVLEPVPGYWRGIREVCDRHGVLLILDEVMGGMGRCGSLWACEPEGISPDIATIAKGLGAGYQPIGAMLLSRRIYQAIQGGSGAFQHGHTYLGHAVACAAALAVQHTLEREGLLERVRVMGARLASGLRQHLGGHPRVGDIRGRGLFMALELVADRASREPFDPALRVHARFKQAAMARGLMTYPMGGTLDGTRGDHIVLAPPFIIDEARVDLLIERLGSALPDTLARLPV